MRGRRRVLVRSRESHRRKRTRIWPGRQARRQSKAAAILADWTRLIERQRWRCWLQLEDGGIDDAACDSWPAMQPVGLDRFEVRRRQQYGQWAGAAAATVVQAIRGAGAAARYCLRMHSNVRDLDAEADRPVDSCGTGQLIHTTTALGATAHEMLEIPWRSRADAVDESPNDKKGSIRKVLHVRQSALGSFWLKPAVSRSQTPHGVCFAGPGLLLETSPTHCNNSFAVAKLTSWRAPGMHAVDVISVVLFLPNSDMALSPSNSNMFGSSRKIALCVSPGEVATG